VKPPKKPPPKKPPPKKPPPKKKVVPPVQQQGAQQRVDVKTPEGKDIEYIYDFESIFANKPEQKPKKMARGGAVADALSVNDELIKILRG
jgi:hypothetical protein